MKRRRKSGKPQHLPKVGTTSNLEYEKKHEGAAVLENFGLHQGRGGGSWVWWTAVAVLIGFAVLALVAFVFWV